MSFNLHAGPGRTVIVNNASTSPSEDGTWLNPYKTIQAAFDARPAITGGTEFLLWEVFVMPGFYDEDLVLPPLGVWALRSLSGFALGIPGGVQRSVTWDTVLGAGVPSIGIIGTLGGGTITITGGFTITGGVSARPTLFLHGVVVQDPLDGTGILDANNSSITIERGAFNNGINANAWVQVTDCDPDGLTCFNSRQIRDATIGGNLVVTDISSVEGLKLDHVEVTGNVVLAGVKYIYDMEVAGTFTQVGAGDYIDQLRVTGNAQFGLFGRVSHSRFEANLNILGQAQLDHVVVLGTTTNMGGLYASNCFFGSTVIVDALVDMFVSVILGMVTASTITAVGSAFDGGATVLADSQFMSSSMQVAFNGPPGSFRLDAATNALSPATPPGVKTLIHSEVV